MSASQSSDRRAAETTALTTGSCIASDSGCLKKYRCRSPLRKGAARRAPPLQQSRSPAVHDPGYRSRRAAAALVARPPDCSFPPRMRHRWPVVLVLSRSADVAPNIPRCCSPSEWRSRSRRPRGNRRERPSPSLRPDIRRAVPIRESGPRDALTGSDAASRAAQCLAVSGGLGGSRCTRLTVGEPSLPKGLLLLPDGRDQVGPNVGTNMGTLVTAAHAERPICEVEWLAGANAGLRTPDIRITFWVLCPEVSKPSKSVSACMQRFT